MPYSAGEGDSWIRDHLIEIAPTSVLDIGPGAGKYGTMCRSINSVAILDAVEIFEPYINRFRLNDIYNTVVVGDIRQHDDFSYDVVIFGDVLEHMSEAEAVAVWNTALSHCGYLILSIPTIHYPQGEFDGNEHEAHIVDDWDAEKVLGSFAGIYDYKIFEQTGSFIARGKYAGSLQK